MGRHRFIDGIAHLLNITLAITNNFDQFLSSFLRIDSRDSIDDRIAYTLTVIEFLFEIVIGFPKFPKFVMEKTIFLKKILSGRG